MNVNILTRIEDLQLSPRTYARLKRAKLLMVKDFLIYTQEDLLELRGFGQVKLDDLIKALEKIGVVLPTKNPETDKGKNQELISSKFTGYKKFIKQQIGVKQFRVLIQKSESAKILLYETDRFSEETWAGCFLRRIAAGMSCREACKISWEQGRKFALANYQPCVHHQYPENYRLFYSSAQIISTTREALRLFSRIYYDRVFFSDECVEKKQ